MSYLFQRTGRTSTAKKIIQRSQFDEIPKPLNAKLALRFFSLFLQKDHLINSSQVRALSCLNWLGPLLPLEKFIAGLMPFIIINNFEMLEM